nr:DJ-1/PfpI family protein [uncultured Roseococcus sp.]
MTHDTSSPVPGGLARRGLAAAAMGSALLSAPQASAQPTSLAPAGPSRPPRPAGPPITVAMLVHPQMILLDLAGPQTILKILGADIHLVGETLDPVSTDVGINVTPTMTLADCPRELDVLFVPGGLMGSIATMGNTTVLDFLADRGGRARYVTSVCTGGLVLAAAGLLRGYRATAHWGVADLLPLMGAIRDPGRVVRDRNRLTGAGATSGLDFGLTLAALLRGQEAAERVQLILEYSPQPPFRAGTPEEIGPDRLAVARAGRVWMDGQARQASLAAARRLGI